MIVIIVLVRITLAIFLPKYRITFGNLVFYYYLRTMEDKKKKSVMVYCPEDLLMEAKLVSALSGMSLTGFFVSCVRKEVESWKKENAGRSLLELVENRK